MPGDDTWLIRDVFFFVRRELQELNWHLQSVTTWMRAHKLKLNHTMEIHWVGGKIWELAVQSTVNDSPLKSSNIAGGWALIYCCHFEVQFASVSHNSYYPPTSVSGEVWSVSLWWYMLWYSPNWYITVPLWGNLEASRFLTDVVKWNHSIPILRKLHSKR